ETSGALVADVLDKGPAAKAKLQPGDVITGYNGQAVADAAQLRMLVAETPPGTPVKLSILREGRSQDVTLTIGELPPDTARLDRQPQDEKGRGEHALAGIAVEPAPDGRSGFFRRQREGVVVSDVEPDSPAERAGVRPGDLIREINRQPVKSVRDFERIAGKLDPGEHALLLLRRGEASSFVSVNPAG
ncbi:MAG TPA: PDZ domain-containing protein, partial [Nitrospiraceae bacterium]|nr:PDZ domain-containing protein [Nitrospiraceae bacterium]